MQTNTLDISSLAMSPFFPRDEQSACAGRQQQLLPANAVQRSSGALSPSRVLLQCAHPTPHSLHSLSRALPCSFARPPAVLMLPWRCFRATVRRRHCDAGAGLAAPWRTTDSLGRQNRDEMSQMETPAIDRSSSLTIQTKEKATRGACMWWCWEMMQMGTRSRSAQAKALEYHG